MCMKTLACHMISKNWSGLMTGMNKIIIHSQNAKEEVSNLVKVASVGNLSQMNHLNNSHTWRKIRCYKNRLTHYNLKLSNSNPMSRAFTKMRADWSKTENLDAQKEISECSYDRNRNLDRDTSESRPVATTATNQPQKTSRPTAILTPTLALYPQLHMYPQIHTINGPI